jgi:acetyl esterase/lipase
MKVKEFLSFPWKEMLFPGDGEKSVVALSLFAASIALTDHYVKVNIDAIGDICTNILHRILPISWQSKVRDSGFISWVVDYGAYLVALDTARLDWQLMLDFWTVTSKLKRFQYGETADHTLEVFQPEDSSRYHKNLVHGAESKLLCQAAQKAAFSTLVFVHGGAWGCGRPWHYRMVANGLGNLLGVKNVVVVGYPTYPESTILQQRDFVTSALRFLQSDSNVGSTPTVPTDNIVLCGHSSGANICALSLLDNLNTAQTPSNNTSPQPTPFRVHTFIGLAGVYDIGKHYLFESNRGVQVISPMCTAACGRKCFGMCSPTVVARGMKRLLDAKKASAGENTSLTSSSAAGCSTEVVESGSVSSGYAMQYTMPHTVLIHGEGDMVVPFSSSAEFGTALQDLGVKVDLISINVSTNSTGSKLS